MTIKKMRATFSGRRHLDSALAALNEKAMRNQYHQEFETFPWPDCPQLP